MTGRRVMGGFLLVVAAAGCSANAQVAEPSPVAAPVDVTATTTASRPPVQLATVQTVLDGRSMLLSDGTKAEIPGLAPPGPCWAQAASDFATKMLLNQPVRLDRTTGALSLEDGTDFALLAIGNGAARTGPNASAAMKDAEAVAQKGTLGLWGPPCTGLDVTATPAPPPPPPPPAPAPPAPKPKPTTTTPRPKPVYFRSCEEAHRAGAAPIYWGQPGYRVELDQNRNGIACE